MAGNTKFIGFGDDNHVFLERWGKKVSAALPEVAIEVLKELCYKHLPKKPPVQQPRTDVHYDEVRGEVVMSLSPERAVAVSDTLISWIERRADTPDDHETGKVIRGLVEGIHGATKDHIRFISVQDEPGVD